MQREKILANFISDKGFVSRICTELIQFNNENKNSPVENGERICTDMSPKKIYKWPTNT